VQLSVIVPTRNRADIWRRRWLLDALDAQTKPPDELVIALDNTEDATAAAILTELELHPPRYQVRIIEVLKPRPEPFPASGYPDNCLFHAADGEVILHIDDDIALPPGYIEHTRNMFEGLPSAVIWGLLEFVDETKAPIPETSDCRPAIARKHNWQLQPGGLWLMPLQHQVHWGAVYAVTARDIRAIGGHNVEHCGHHNTDTRLGNRLARFCRQSLVTSTPATTARHLGTTWHMKNRNNPHEIRKAQGNASGPKIANGGQAFWTSDWFTAAYATIHDA
jgi:glycosyltransferase involved in cell wall biosynthesis